MTFDFFIRTKYFLVLRQDTVIRFSWELTGLHTSKIKSPERLGKFLVVFIKKRVIMSLSVFSQLIFRVLNLF